MQLARISYRGAAKTDTFLAVVLGTHGGKISCLKSEFLSGQDIVLLGGTRDQLKKLELFDKINWCRKNLSGYNKAFRTLSEEKAKIEETYG